MDHKAIYTGVRAEKISPLVTGETYTFLGSLHERAAGTKFEDATVGIDLEIDD